MIRQLPYKLGESTLLSSLAEIAGTNRNATPPDLHSSARQPSTKAVKPTPLRPRKHAAFCIGDCNIVHHGGHH